MDTTTNSNRMLLLSEGGRVFACVLLWVLVDNVFIVGLENRLPSPLGKGKEDVFVLLLLLLLVVVWWDVEGFPFLCCMARHCVVFLLPFTPIISFWNLSITAFFSISVAQLRL